MRTVSPVLVATQDLEMFRWTLFLSLVVPAVLMGADGNSISSALFPENVIHPGHSMFGETFDEGPRRSASLLGNTGRVTFPITTTNPLVQQYFNQGVGQLHGFWYFEAERSFRQAAQLEPDCAMSYYGMALANTNNEARAKGFIAQAVKRKDKVSDRERRYIDALDTWYKAETGDEKKAKSRAKKYVAALEDLLYQYPDDLEAKAMLCLILWQKRSDLELSSYLAIDALMNDVLAVNPYHPIHHFRVHLWDNDKAKVAETSAERCGLSAPGIAHMWHMSGHTYSEMHRYFDAVWHQEASARTDHAYMIRDGIFPDRIHNFAHNNEWLVKNMQYLGRINDAIELARNTIELPRHPKLNPLPGGKSAHYGRLRLFQNYSQFELWDRLIADAQTQILGPTTDESEQIKYFRHLGRAYFMRKDVSQGTAQLEILKRRLKRLKQDTDAAVDTAVARALYEGKDNKVVVARKNEATQSTSEQMKSLERAVDELQGHLLLIEGKPVEALALFNKASDVDEIFLANVEFQAGKPDEALKRLRDRVKSSQNQVRPLASLVEMLWKQQKKDDAKQTFESLREISGSIDLEMPPFARLQPIAMELGYGVDWRKPKPVPRNVAELPDLKTLGPFTWQPSGAQDWSLPDENRQLISLADYRDRPVVILFYLGSGCLHCAEQLQLFAKHQQQFARSGISLIGITTDTTEVLKKSLERNSSDGSFPFKIVSDSELKVFKRYQAFDDFEGIPLHATYLVDGSGKIRWHEVGAEPFMDVEFLHGECRRLLFPAQVTMPKEPDLIDESAPADALSPRNVFPATTPTPSKKSDRGDLAADARRD